MSIVTYRNSFQKLDGVIFKINKPLIGKKGIHYQKLLQDWQAIVGEYVGSLTIPVRISSIKSKNQLMNVLHIATNNASTAIEISYHIGIIKEQVNVFLGYEYIQQIKLSQAVFSVVNYKQNQERSLSEEEREKAYQLTQIYDQQDDIKDILVEFANSIYTKST